MTVALRSPTILRAVIPVDNAPVDANLKSDFHKYVRGLREIEEQEPQKQAEADAILQNYEKERMDCPPLGHDHRSNYNCRLWPSDNFC